MKTRRVRLLGTTSALAETDYELRDYDRLPPRIHPTDPDGSLRTRLEYVWVLTDDGWRIVSAQTRPSAAAARAQALSAFAYGP